MLLFVGDVHGRFSDLRQLLERHSIREAAIVQVGDLGVGFQQVEEDRAELGKLDSYLGGRDCTLYAIRGNHDNPSYFEGDEDDGPSALVRAGPEPMRHVHLLPDYSVLELEGYKLLLAGGAVSVDR